MAVSTSTELTQSKYVASESTANITEAGNKRLLNTTLMTEGTTTNMHTTLETPRQTGISFTPGQLIEGGGGGSLMYNLVYFIFYILFYINLI